MDLKYSDLYLSGKFFKKRRKHHIYFLTVTGWPSSFEEQYTYMGSSEDPENILSKVSQVGFNFP